MGIDIRDEFERLGFRCTHKCKMKDCICEQWSNVNSRISIYYFMDDVKLYEKHNKLMKLFYLGLDLYIVAFYLLYKLFKIVRKVIGKVKILNKG